MLQELTFYFLLIKYWRCFWEISNIYISFSWFTSKYSSEIIFRVIQGFLYNKTLSFDDLFTFFVIKSKRSEAVFWLILCLYKYYFFRLFAGKISRGLSRVKKEFSLITLSSFDARILRRFFLEIESLLIMIGFGWYIKHAILNADIIH